MKRLKAEKKKRTEEELFLYGQYVSWVLCFFIMIWLRSRLVWMCEILPLGSFYSMLALIILVVLFSVLHIIGGNITILDCVALGTLPFTVYINIVTIVTIPWMRVIGIAYILLMFILKKYQCF